MEGFEGSEEPCEAHSDVCLPGSIIDWIQEAELIQGGRSGYLEDRLWVHD